MNSQCETVRYILVEGSGDLRPHDAAVADHLKKCKDCQEFAAAEKRLAEIFENASLAADPDLQQRVIHAVRGLEARRRRWAFAPVAASVILMLAGVTILGGIPATSMAAALPAWTCSGWLALAGSVMDFASALRAVAVGLGSIISWPVILGAMIFSVAGIGTLISISKRWRRRAAWSDRS